MFVTYMYMSISYSQYVMYTMYYVYHLLRSLPKLMMYLICLRVAEIVCVSNYHYCL